MFLIDNLVFNWRLFGVFGDLLAFKFFSLDSSFPEKNL